MAGFPAGWQEGRRNYPIVRGGVLAQIQGWLNGDHDAFLVDGSGFPCNSGSPVLIKMIYFDQRHAVTRRFFSLIGMVSTTKAISISKENQDLSESADLIEVIPVDAIEETIQMAMAKESSDGNETEKIL